MKTFNLNPAARRWLSSCRAGSAGGFRSKHPLLLRVFAPLRFFVVLLLLALFLCATAQAQTYSLGWGTVAAGGGQGTTGNATLSGSIGVAGVSHVLHPPTTGTDYFTNLWNTSLTFPPDELLTNDSPDPVYPPGTPLTLVSVSPTSANGGTVAWQPAGTTLWTNGYNGPGNNYDSANAMAVDGSGNVYVTGFATRTNGSADYATLAYSSAGMPLWTNWYNGSGNGDNLANAIAVDSSGNVYVTGFSYGTNGSYDYATVAYSSAGAPLWTNRYNGPGNNSDYANAVAVDGSGNVYVTGSSVGSGSGDDYATVAYSSAGVPLWTNRYNGPGNNSDSANAVAVDTNGNVYVTGFSVGSGSGNDYATVAYSSAGVQLWVSRYNGTGNYNDYANAVAVDASGNVYVTGYSYGSRGLPDYATVAYTSTGVPLWTNSFYV
jgi:hypothetical protein